MSDIYNLNKYKINPKVHTLVKKNSPDALNAVRHYLEVDQKMPPIVIEFIISYWLDLYLVRLFFATSMQVMKDFFDARAAVEKLPNLKKVSLSMDVFTQIEFELIKNKKLFVLFTSYLQESGYLALAKGGKKNFKFIATELRKKCFATYADMSCARKKLARYLYHQQDELIHALKRNIHKAFLTEKQLIALFNKLLRYKENLQLHHNLLNKKIVPAAEKLVALSCQRYPPAHYINSDCNLTLETTGQFWVAERSKNTITLPICLDICGSWTNYDPTFVLVENRRKAQKLAKLVAVLKALENTYTPEELNAIIQMQANANSH